MDWIDQIIVKKAKLYMTSFDLTRFKIDYPSLYSTIRESIKEAASIKLPQN